MVQNPKVLLLGNGINRAFDFASWEDMLTSIKTSELTDEEKRAMECIPYPLQAVIKTGDNVDHQMKEIAARLVDMSPSADERELLQRFSMLPINAILTTNYTYEIEKALDKDFTCKIGLRCKNRKVTKQDAGGYERAQLHTFFDMGEKYPGVWHIHGEAAKHQTMIIGHYYYGKLIAKSQKHIANYMAIYKTYLSGKTDFAPSSWIDCFMLGDIYIVGLGLDVSEMDLWWLISCKKLHFSDTKVVLYKPDIKPAERMLARAYNVEVIEEGLLKKDYKSYYSWVCDQINNSFCENKK